MKFRLVSTVVPLVLLAGCAQILPGFLGRGDRLGGWAGVSSLSHEERRAEAEDVQALIAYFQKISGMSADDLRKEFAGVNLVFNRDKNEDARMKLVLLMSLPGGTFRDDGRLASLLEGSASRAAPRDSPRQQFLILLSRLNSERLRQVGSERESAKKLDAQLKEEQRRADEEQKRADELQKRVEEAQKRADEAQQKLDKLLAIEREMRTAPRRLPK